MSIFIRDHTQKTQYAKQDTSVAQLRIFAANAEGHGVAALAGVATGGTDSFGAAAFASDSTWTGLLNI